MSDSVLAITGIADTHIVTPMNSARTTRLVWPLATTVAGKNSPSVTPRARGTMRLSPLTVRAVPPMRRSRRRSSWVPVTPTSSTAPTWAMPSSRCIWFASAGNSQCEAPGSTCRSNEGPKITPVASSPTIAGMPMRAASRPSSRATASRTAIAAR